MFGLIVAAAIFMFYFLNSSEDQSLYILAAMTLPFLWYWHWFWTVCKGLLVGILGVLGLIVGFSSDKEAKRVGIILTLSSPLLMIVFSITSALFIASVYCLSQGLNSTEGLVNERYAIVGAVLYGIGVLTQIVFKGTGSAASSKNKD